MDIVPWVNNRHREFSGNIHWSFSSERYFGKLGPEIKSSLKVELLPEKTDHVGVVW